MIQNLDSGRRVSISEAQEMSQAGTFIHWRPESNLPEREQYALAFENL